MKIFNPIKEFLNPVQKVKRWQKIQGMKKELDELYKENPVLTKAQRDIILKIREEYVEKQRETMIKYLRREAEVLKDIKLKIQE